MSWVFALHKKCYLNVSCDLYPNFPLLFVFVFNFSVTMVKIKVKVTL
jgi:hypothetical protein